MPLPRTAASMKKLIIGLALLTTLYGCGGSEDTSSSAAQPITPVPVTDEQRVQQAMVDDPATAVQLIPSKHLDPIPQSTNPRGTPMTISVADLETAYETLFCSLNSSLGVTKSTPQVAADIQFIQSQSGTGFFDLNAQPILNNPLGVTGVSFQPVDYSTTVPLPAGNQTFQVSGGLLMPVGITKDQIKGVVVYFHGTTFNKSQVGSEYQNNNETQLTAQVFGSQGYIVVIPDYVGQGVDWQDAHPYVLYPKVSAQTAVDMLTAVQPLIASQYGFQNGDPALKLFSAGYSEGGSYSLWFNSYLSSNPGLLSSFYVLTHSVGMEGAYNTSSITYGYLFDDVSTGGGDPYNVQSQTLVNIVKPILSADAFLSYAVYSASSDFDNIFNSRFFNMSTTFPVPQSLANVNGSQVTIAAAFAQPDTTIATQLLAAGLGKTANGASYPGPLELLTSSSNGISSLVSSTLLQPGPLAELQQVLVAADLDLSPCANQGVSIVTLDEDSVVVPNNFDFIQATYPGKILNAYKIDHTQLQVLSPFSPKLGKAIFQPADHLNGPVYEFLYALNIFNGF